MIAVKKFNSIADIQKVQQLACVCPDPVFIHSMDNSVMVDAKSFINLYTLDFSKEVQIVSDNEELIQAVKEI